MSIFKRIEVWILLVLTVAGLVFVILSGGGDADGRGGSGKPAKPADGDGEGNAAIETGASKFAKGGLIEVKKVSVKRDYSDYIAEVFFSYDNRSDSEVRSFEEVKLITAEGKPLPVFFLAFTGVPEKLPAKQKTDTSLRFMIFRDDIVGKLSLDIRGERVPIKSEQSFDPGSIRNQETRTFRDLDW